MTRLPIIVIGAGGHAKVVIDALKKSGAEIQGVAEIDPKKAGGALLGVPVIDESALPAPGAVALANGVGSVKDTKARRAAFLRLKEQGYRFQTVIHPSGVIGEDVVIGEGAEIMAGAVIQPGTRIGANSIVNTRASVDHDCQIGDHVHIAPGAALSGSVMMGDGCHVGAGATVMQGKTIGRGAVVGAGAVVVDDVPPGVTVYGVPAREA